MRRALSALKMEGKTINSLLKRRRSGSQNLLSLAKTSRFGFGLRKVINTVGNLPTRLASLASDFPVSTGNQVQAYFDGAKVWRDMWHAIENAKHYVWVSTFIIEDDDIGRKTILELTKAAQRGCKVIFIYDYFGSIGVRQGLFDDLRASGGVVLTYRSLLRSLLSATRATKWESPFRRVHQKLLVVDGEVGFCGGMNIGCDYAAVDVGGTGRFRDTHCRVVGPAVESLQQAFIKTVKKTTKDWEELTQTPARSIKKVSPFQSLRDHHVMSRAMRHRRGITGLEKATNQLWKGLQAPKIALGTLFGFLGRMANYSPQDGLVVVLESHGEEDKHFGIQEAFLQAIQDAKHKINISTPYFMPPPPVEAMLIGAAQRGVQVEIITQGKSDVFVSSWAAQYAYTKYIRIEGFTIHEVVGQELHAKTTVIDNHYASIGSDNLDHISWGYNREAKLAIFDRNVVKQIRERFEIDKTLSRPITVASWEAQTPFYRAIALLAYHAYHFIYPWNVQIPHKSS